jgi:hypothetical protein
MEYVMPRSKIIRAFVAVWCVVCLSYVGVRTAVTGFWDSSTVAVEDVEEAPSATESAEQDELAEWDEPTDQDEPREHTATGSTAQSEPVTQAEPDDSNARSDSMEWEEQESAEYQDVDQEEQVADVPSLEEYLSGFTCGSCRRNCSLDSPRCHNGSRLAQAKAEEYYSIYG